MTKTTKRTKSKDQEIDYSKLPKLTGDEWYNVQVFGQKTQPKVKKG